MRTYYNEWDPYAAAWLRNLIAAGHLPAGDVDQRSITEVSADDLRPYSSAHFFAGLGGWPYAARLAGWPDDRPLWTGSCPCQPFSQAGKGQGESDPRHLWPEMRRLVAEFRPPVVAGEQVASPKGRRWLTGVRADLEVLGYAVGAADLCAASIEAPHIRQRLFWVADAPGERNGRRLHDGPVSPREGYGTECDCADGGMAHGEEYRRRERGPITSGSAEGTGAEGAGFGPADDRGSNGGLGDADRAGSFTGRVGAAPDRYGRPAVAASGPWADAGWIPCLDGKWRRIKPGLEPLAHGVPNRVGRLRAYGNAIVPQLAAEFLTAYMEARQVAA